MKILKKVFCSTSFSSELCGYCQVGKKEDFSIFKNTEITVSLDGTFFHMQKVVQLLLISKGNFEREGNFALQIYFYC